MKRILIIGGGVSGLSAGIYALLNGYGAVICEKNAVAGGNLTGWDREGYHIDNCIHWLTGTNPATEEYKMWCELGVLGGVDVYYGDALYTVEYKGRTMSLCRNVDALKEKMLAASPADKNETLSFIRAVKAVQGIEGIAGEKCNEKSGTLKKLTDIPLLLKYYALTAGELAARFTDPLIRRFLTSLLTKDFGSLALLVVFADYCGGNGGIPAGGSRAAAARMVKRFEALGGTLLLNKEAKKLNVINGRASSVSFADGTEIFADDFVITVDPASVFGRMIDGDMPGHITDMYKNDRLKRFSSVHCAFACEESKLPFKGDMIIETPARYADMLHSENVVLREFSHESGFAPAGRNIIQAMVFCGESAAKKYISLKKDGGAYERMKKSFSETVRKTIERRYPSLAGKLKCIDVWTPATYRRYTGSDAGTYMSFAFSSGYLPLRKKCAVPYLKNVFLATQWLKAPGGLPIAAGSGKDAADAVMRADVLAETEAIPRKAVKRKINKV